MEKEVAIIIPTLNEERFVGRCLDSVIAQTFPFAKIDLMVVDGGSNDRTKDIVETYQMEYPNIRFLQNPKRIQSVAFNMGVNASTAPYVIRLDAHASYDENYVERCLINLKADGGRGNVGGRCVIKPFDDSLWAIANAILNYSRFGIGGSAFRVGRTAQNVDTVPFGTFPRQVLEEIGGMREDLKRGEDNEINSRIRKAGYSVYFDPEIVSTYFARPTLKASCKQMYANGESIGQLLYIDRHSIGLRHVIPLLFVIGIFIGIIMSIAYHPFVCLLVAGMSLYFLCNFVASAAAASKYGWKYCFPLIALFFSVHVSYGIGTIKGLSKYGRRKKKY